MSSLPPREAVDWIAGRSPEVIIAQREEMIGRLESAAGEMRASGLQQSWLGTVDPLMMPVVESTNGYLMEQLLAAAGYCDVGAASLLRDGGLPFPRLFRVPPLRPCVGWQVHPSSASLTAVA